MLPTALLIVAVLIGGLAALRLGSGPRWQGWTAAAGSIGIALIALAIAPGELLLRKAVAACLMPAGLVWVGLAALAVTLWRRGLRRPATAAAGLFILYTAAGNPVLGGALLSILERPYAPVDPLRVGRFDAVIALGGGASLREDGEPTLGCSADRILLAARLYREGAAATLVCSGPYVLLPDGRRAGDPEATEAVWVELGVPADRIVRLDGPATTSEEIPAFRDLAARRGWRRVGIVTSAWHLRRAMRLAARAGLDATPLPADRHEYREGFWRWIVPQDSGFRLVQTACWEFLGGLAGR